MNRLSPYFCGRDEELLQIQTAFLHVGEAESNRIAVQGISGLGKSQLAMHYAKMSFTSNIYQHVFWISANTDAKFIEGMSGVLNAIQHPLRFTANQIDKVETTRLWLENCAESERWLLILDNVEPSVVTTILDNLPSFETVHGHIICTTRRLDVAKRIANKQAVIELQGLKSDDATDLLLKASGYDPKATSTTDKAAANTLVKRTGYHALAISFAATSIEQGLTTLDEISEWTETDQLAYVSGNVVLLMTAGLKPLRLRNGLMRWQNRISK